MDKSSKKLRLLVVGSLPPPVGGTSVSLMHLVTFIKNHHSIDLTIIDTSSVHLCKSTIRLVIIYLKIIYDLLLYAKNVDIVTLHVGTRSLPTLGLIVLLISKVYRKKIIIRKFNGIDFLDLSIIKKYISLFIVKKADLYLPQTKTLVASACKHSIQNVKWFPTHRPLEELPDKNKSENRICRRFVFVGQLHSTKGVNELIDAGEKMPEDVKIDVYGELKYDITIDVFKGLKNVRYKGVVDYNQVGKCIKQYDALVLPTYYNGEGYPGAIIEAFSAGIPVITTNWKSIPELVDNYSGIVIEPRDTVKLFNAMMKLYHDTILYKSLTSGVIKKRMEYSLEFWGGEFISYCKEIFEKD